MGVMVKRSDIEIKNERGLKLVCSFFEPQHQSQKQLPCVIYMHGNSSSRLECLPCIETLVPSYISVFSFDFSGCGKSEGEYISLGWFEKDDVKAVINYLRGTGRVSTIGLWGRSMGAATALIYVQEDPSVAGIVLDSSFQSLNMLAEELTSTFAPKLPKLMVSSALSMIKKTVQQKAHFDINKLNPIDFAKIGFVPAFFIHGEQDNFIKKHHSQNLFDCYPGDKKISFVEGEHNSNRPQFIMDSIGIFFYNTLQCEALIPKFINDKTRTKNSDKLQFHHSPSIPKFQIGNETEIKDIFENFDPDLEEALRLSLEESQKKSEFKPVDEEQKTEYNEKSKSQLKPSPNLEKVNNIENKDDDLIDFDDQK